MPPKSKPAAADEPLATEPIAPAADEDVTVAAADLLAPPADEPADEPQEPAEGAGDDTVAAPADDDAPEAQEPAEGDETPAEGTEDLSDGSDVAQGLLSAPEIKDETPEPVETPIYGNAARMEPAAAEVRRFITEDGEEVDTDDLFTDESPMFTYVVTKHRVIEEYLPLGGFTPVSRLVYPSNARLPRDEAARFVAHVRDAHGLPPVVHTVEDIDA